jgi:tRNA dimethylallyltransferase
MRPAWANATQKLRRTRPARRSGIAPAGVSVIIGPAMEPILHVLTGPTAVGKTEWALRWAESRGAEIVSCDSLQLYRGMNIGTAKPTAAERARVPHHLIDLLDVTESCDITRYVAAARAACEAIRARGRPVLVTGGSGFYLKAFLAPVADDVDVPAEVRAAVADRLEREGLPALVAELRRRNPAGLGALDTHNPRRVVRALERCRASGRTLAELAAAFARQPAPLAGWTARLVQLDRPRAELEARIEARVHAMLAAGLVDEVRQLLAAGLKRNPSAARAIGYRETTAMLEGRLPAEELAAAMVKNTRALVKKQLTWFRTQLPPHPVLAADRLTLDALFPEAPATGARR